MGDLAPFDRRVLAGDAPDVAPRLLNALLVHGGCVGRIVEVEAYRPDDPASHSFAGRTQRNAAMFGPPGHLYVYLIYGIHHCANIVTGPPGEGAAVLVRAVTPVAGEDVMRARRGAGRGVADGPGKLCQAFAIDRSHDGTDLCTGDDEAVAGPRLLTDGTPPPEHPLVGPRVGLSVATDTPWRWRITSGDSPRT